MQMQILVFGNQCSTERRWILKTLYTAFKFLFFCLFILKWKCRLDMDLYASYIWKYCDSVFEQLYHVLQSALWVQPFEESEHVREVIDFANHRRYSVISFAGQWLKGSSVWASNFLTMQVAATNTRNVDFQYQCPWQEKFLKRVMDDELIGWKNFSFHQVLSWSTNRTCRLQWKSNGDRSCTRCLWKTAGGVFLKNQMYVQIFLRKNLKVYGNWLSVMLFVCKV